MEKIYTYENGTVIVKLPTEEQLIRIKKATAEFALKLDKEGMLNGDFNTRRDI